MTLSVRNRISRRDTVELCEQLFSSRISTGTVEAILQRAADALVEPCADLLERVRAASALNIDETGWRLRGGQRALWGAFTDRHAILTIEPDRHEDRAKDLLADTEAIVTSDRWWAYSHLPIRRRQICWSHLQRDFAFHAEGRGIEKELGEHGLRSARRSSGRGRSSSTPATAPSSSAASVRCGASSSRSCASTPAPRPATARAAASRATCSRSGRHCGRSPRTRACSRPTTTPNARYAAQSSTASSASAASPSMARTDRPAALSPHHLPAPATQPARLPDRPLRAHARGDPAPLLA